MLGLGLGLTRLGGRKAFSPADVSGLVGWWDASDTSTITESSGSVSQLDDKSGNGLHMVQATASAQPTTGTRSVNGRNVLAFDGADSLAVSSSSGNSSLTWFVVGAQDNALSAAGAALFATEGGTSARRGLLVDTRTSPIRLFFQIAYSVNTFLDLSAANTSTSPRLLSITIATDGAAVAFQNGIQQSTGSVPALTTGDTLKLGSQNAPGSFDLDGVICEAIAYNAVLSTADRTSVEAYLMNKWGL